MKLKAYAKINFYLEILGKRYDGYHNLQSIMQQIDLHDVLMFQPADMDYLTIGSRVMPKDNLVTQTVMQVRKIVPVPPVRINLEKNIPIGAGLGGGSSDAAAVIMGLNELFSLNLSEVQMHTIGKQMGADVPFFLRQTAALIEGIGTEITPLEAIDLPHILLARPKGYISTPTVYKELKPTDYQTPGDIKSFINDWKHGILGECFNHLEAPAFRLDPKIEKLKSDMMKTNPMDCLMTGSGNVVFAVYDSAKELQKALEAIREKAYWVLETKSIKDKHDQQDS